MHACFKLGDRTYCVPTPIVRLPRIPIDTILDPGQPDPWPWLRGSDLRAGVAHDLSVLATVEVLVEQVKSQKLKKQLGLALQGSLSALELPSDLHISFGNLDVPKDVTGSA